MSVGLCIIPLVCPDVCLLIHWSVGWLICLSVGPSMTHLRKASKTLDFKACSLCQLLSLCMCLSFCQSLSISVCLSVYRSVYLSVYLSLSIYLSICLSSSKSLSIYLHLCLCLSPSICLSPSNCFSPSVFGQRSKRGRCPLNTGEICASVRPSVCPSICPSPPET